MSEQRKHYPAPDKVAILRLHLLEKKPVSAVCAQFNRRVRFPCRRDYLSQSLANL
jgi:transposase-like protein